VRSGPPAPATVKVPMSDGRQHVYRLSVVGSWSAPADPIAIYNDTGPPSLPPLSEQEQAWLRNRVDE
jgi:hypothetical protein